MYKFMIVDDEHLVLKNMKMIIEKYFPTVGEIITTDNGVMAIEYAYKYKPDIIFMDIRMPGINGIDAIKEIKRKHKDTIIFIISAYAQFSYAKSAMEVGAKDYFLKPLDKKAIIDVVKKALETIDEERVKNIKEVLYKQKIMEAMPFVENQFLYSLLFKNFYDSNEFDVYKNIFEIELKKGCIMTVSIEMKDGSSVETSYLEIYKFIRSILKNLTNCLVGNIFTNKVVVFFPMDISMGENEHIMNVKNLGLKLIKNLDSEENLYGIKIGIGRIYEEKDNIYKSYIESVKALNVCEIGEIEYFNNRYKDETVKFQYPVADEQKFLESLNMGNQEESLSSFNKIINWFTKRYPHSFENIKSGLTQIAVLMYRNKDDDNNNELLKKQEYIQTFFAISDINELIKWFEYEIKFICETVNSNKQDKIYTIIEKAKKYVDENYNCDISLESVAQEIGLSPQYLSFLFHKKIGQNFIDYLTEVRITKAKNLLENTNKSIKEISNEVGYNNPNYFSRVFKKISGISPTEWS